MKGAVLQDSTGQGADSVAAQFVRARLSARPLDKYPGAVPANLKSAYHCQDQAIEAWPDEIAGWKVARVPKEWAEKFPEPRINGPAFRRNIYVAAHGAIPACPVFEGGFAAVETEIVVRVKADAPAKKYEWSIAEATDYVGDMHIGVEVASSPLATLNDLGTGAVISDFGNNWGIVVGDPIADWREIASVSCETFIDDQSVGARAVSIEQGPLAALAFTLGKCAERGRPLRAGAWITTGMITGVHDIGIGQRSRHMFAGYGQVNCRIVRAEPFE
jgi:2-keto-4-pentenoate hydratase